jgi:hypothetical protein
MPSIDTIVLTAQDFKVSHRNSLIVKPKSHPAYVEESEITELLNRSENDILFRDDLGVDHCGSSAYYNRIENGETAGQFSISRYGLKIQFSFPKIYTNNNANYFDARNTNKVLKTMQSVARDAGIDFNILDSKVSRIDTPTDAVCKYGYNLYAPFIGQISNRMSNMVTYSSHYLRTGNKSNQVCFYAKDEKNNLYRLEPRLLKSEAVNAMAKKVGEINARTIGDLDLIRSIYRYSTIKKMDISTIQKTFLDSKDEDLLMNYLIQVEYQEAYKEKNFVALQLMEIDGIETKLKNITMRDAMRIRTKVHQTVSDDCHKLNIIDAQMLNMIDATSVGATKRMMKKRYIDEARHSTPTLTTDESKQSISDEFIAKFLTV